MQRRLAGWEERHGLAARAACAGSASRARHGMGPAASSRFPPPNTTDLLPTSNLKPLRSKCAAEPPGMMYLPRGGGTASRGSEAQGERVLSAGERRLCPGRTASLRRAQARLSSRPLPTPPTRAGSSPNSLLQHHHFRPFRRQLRRRRQAAHAAANDDSVVLNVGWGRPVAAHRRLRHVAGARRLSCRCGDEGLATPPPLLLPLPLGRRQWRRRRRGSPRHRHRVLLLLPRGPACQWGLPQRSAGGHRGEVGVVVACVREEERLQALQRSAICVATRWGARRAQCAWNGCGPRAILCGTSPSWQDVLSGSQLPPCARAVTTTQC